MLGLVLVAPMWRVLRRMFLRKVADASAGRERCGCRQGRSGGVDVGGSADVAVIAVEPVERPDAADAAWDKWFMLMNVVVGAALVRACLR